MRYFHLIYLVWFQLQTIFWLKIGNVEAIIGGEPAAVDQFKYMVSVQADGKHICGGAILSKSHVITAAHCVIGENNKFINKKYTVLGRVINFLINEVPSIEELVQSIFAPMDYIHHLGKTGASEINFCPEEADIAVLKLKRELPLNEYLSTVKLPSRDGKHNLPRYTYEEAILTGYGSNIDPRRGVKRNHNSTVTTNKQNVRLNFIRANVQHKNACKNNIPYFTHDKYLIAMVRKSRNEDVHGACTGDDGSPLVHDGILIGVLAQYWSNCNESVFGSVYTRVSYYLQYIKDVMKGVCGKKGRYAMYVENTSTTGQTLRNLVEIEEI